MSRPTIEYNPNPAQKRFAKAVALAYRVLLFLAGRQTGKSVALIHEFLKKFYKGKGQRIPLGWLVAPTYNMSLAIERHLVQALQSLIDRGLVKHLKMQRAFILPPGPGSPSPIRIEIKSADRPDTLRGPTVPVIGIDEPAEIDEGAFDILLACGIACHGIILMSGTPKGYNWMHDRIFAKADVYEFDGSVTTNRGGADMAVVRARTEDNCRQHNGGYLDHDEIERVREQYSDDVARQELEGEFVNFTGLVYAKWSRELEYDGRLSQEVNQKTVRRLVGIDYGWDHPFASTYAQKTTDGHYWVDDELYGSQVPIETWAGNLREWKDKRGIATVYAEHDPEKNQALGRFGFYVTEARKDVDAGIQCVVSLIEKKRLHISRERCPNLLKEFQRYQWNKKTGKPVKAFDDACDSLRYLAFSEWMTYDSLLKPPPAEKKIVLGPRGERLWTAEQWSEYAAGFQRLQRRANDSAFPAWFTERN